MKYFIGSVIAIVAIIAVFSVLIKRKSAQILSETDLDVDNPPKLKPQITAPKPETVQSETIAAEAADLLEEEEIGFNGILAEATAAAVEEASAVADDIVVANEVSKERVEEVSQPVVIVTPEALALPEDSMLKRHYLSKLQAEKLAISHPYPSDSALRRHFESALAYSVKPAVSTPLPVAVTAAVVAAAAPVVADAPQPAAIDVAAPAAAASSAIPQDSTLRRHYIAKLQADIEAQLSGKPTDSTLKRHYESHVQAKLAESLAKAA